MKNNVGIREGYNGIIEGLLLEIDNGQFDGVIECALSTGSVMSNAMENGIEERSLMDMTLGVIGEDLPTELVDKIEIYLSVTTDLLETQDEYLGHIVNMIQLAENKTITSESFNDIISELEKLELAIIEKDSLKGEYMEQIADGLDGFLNS